MKNNIDKVLYKIRKNKIFQDISQKWRDIHTVVLFFLFCFGLIIWKLFSYTIVDYDFYNELADKQQIGTFAVPVNRGTIYSSIERNGKNEKSSFLATSINLYDLAIDPSVEGDKQKLGEFLINIVYNETCNNKGREKCKNNLLKFLRVIDLEDFQYTPEYIKKVIGDRIIPRINQTKVTSVLLGSDFSPEQVAEISILNIPGVYPRDNSIYINPEEFSGTDQIIEKLSSVLEFEPERLKYITRKRELKYVPIFNKISVTSSEQIKDLIEEEKDAIGKTILKIEDSIYRFFIMSENPSRYYPEGNIASQIVGFTDNSGIGRYGIEGYFNSILKGNNGKIVARKDTKGRIIDTISIKNDDLIGEGVQIVTTIDRNVQKKVEEILEEGVKRYRANKGTIVVTEPKTGKILAMANYPTYDINNYGDVYELERVNRSKYPNPAVDLLGYPVFVVDSENGKKFIYDNKEIFLREATQEEIENNAVIKYKYKNGFGAGVYRNDAISGLYEPGSIMKGITVAIGIDSGEITEYSKYNDVGKLVIDNFPIENVSNDCLGYHTFEHALDFSCNVGMVRIFQRVGKALVYQYFQDFGFGELTGIDLEGEVFSVIPPWEKWPLSNLYTKSYGLGVAITPLQMVSAYNVLANGGIFVKPKIIEKIIYPNGIEINYKTEEKRRVIKQETADLVTKMLNHGTREGFAKSGAVDGYSIAGKTGTAQIFFIGGFYDGRVQRAGYRNGPGWTNASYAGYGPIEDPKFAIVVKLERPRTNVYGSGTSGELFKQVATYLFDYYGIPKSKK